MEQAEPKIDEKDLLTIFKEFDKDNSGTIELTELKLITEQMGEKMTEKEIGKCMKQMDTNGDGRISFPEFQYWWKFSKKGKMRKVVSLKFKALKYMNVIGSKITGAQVNLKEKYTPQMNTHQINVSFGNGSDNISAGVDLYVGGQQFKDQLAKAKVLVPDLDPSLLTVVLSISTNTPEQKKHQFDAIIEQIKKEADLQPDGLLSEIFKLLSIKSHANADTLAIYASSNKDTPADEFIAAPKEQVQALGQDFSVKISAAVKLFGDLAEGLSSAKFVKWLMHGFAVNFKVETNAVFLKKIRQVIESQVSHENVSQLIPTLIKFSKLNIKLKSPEDISKFFEDLGINQLSEDSPGLKELIEEFSDQMNLSNWKDPTNPFHVVFSILQFINANSNQYLKLQVILPFAIAKLKLKCIGGSNIFYTAFKTEKPAAS